MEQRRNNNIISLFQRPDGKAFVVTGLVALLCGLAFGMLAAVQYVLPGFLRDSFSFERLRPLHVTSVVFWILFCATGGVYHYLNLSGKVLGYKRYLIHYGLFVFTLVAAWCCYLFGVFGGREYWEFPSFIALPFLAGWIIFFSQVIGGVTSVKRMPVYGFMWMTGALFFIITYVESNLWLVPWFRDNLIRDITVQWKSYGAMVGAWNMLIYGCGLFLMERNGGGTYTRSKTAFLIYALGLTNLMFNWGHHLYTVPTAHAIKYVAYAISMTELLLFARIIMQWKKTVKQHEVLFHQPVVKFMAAADAWIFINLGLAILMSVPAINVYTHGTFVTVAHAMGTTIGINSFILFAVAFDVLAFKRVGGKSLNKFYWIANASLLVFFVALVGAGIMKSFWQMQAERDAFGSMMLRLRPFFVAFFIAGCGLIVSFYGLVFPLLNNAFRSKPKEATVSTKAFVERRMPQPEEV